MPRSDRQAEGYRIFIGGVDPRVGKVELEREFDRFGTIVDVWVARNPPGFAFIVYKHLEDAEKAIRRMDRSSPFGSRLRVEHAANSLKYKLEGFYKSITSFSVVHMGLVPLLILRLMAVVDQKFNYRLNSLAKHVFTVKMTHRIASTERSVTVISTRNCLCFSAVTSIDLTDHLWNNLRLEERQHNDYAGLPLCLKGQLLKTLFCLFMLNKLFEIFSIHEMAIDIMTTWPREQGN
ncbi:RNA-binding protein Rsf1 [Echinococcus granulosus]|uniref:RNA-binding protein Rsf1 n=1 Tax=Echinococcus granulosus TaxID=6210 RepID=W6UM78_ECHGR|nr:RNA-binding protein Rsf1 [Echinococcus granulosus]EUB62650.1 RNA-binding protein Rsf1 [Echinococcus granulosus]